MSGENKDKMEEEKIEIVDELDVKLVMAQTLTTREIAVRSLLRNPGDILGAILYITEKRNGDTIKEPT